MISRNRVFKDQLYAQFARIGKAVCSPRRLELLELLNQGERSVEVLAREASVTVANCSQHLQVLQQANLVSTRKDGNHVFYRLAGNAVSSFWLGFRSMAEQQLASIEKLVKDYRELRDDLEPISCSELMGRLQNDDVIVLDVRPEEEYRAGHLPGAIFIHPEEIEQRLMNLPQDREIVAYCRGRYCVWAVQAVKILRKRGYSAKSFQHGIPELRLSGFPVEEGLSNKE